MNTALLDAAFRLVSHSLSTRDPGPFATDAERLAELRRQFPAADRATLADALDRAKELEEAAVELADASRGPRNDGSGPPCDRKALAQQCPGFSDESYGWAVNDGFVLTR